MTRIARLDAVFTLRAAKSQGIKSYIAGPVPFITSTAINNGVVGYVTPWAKDKVFTGPSVAISGLGHATLQTGTFLPKGNGGDSLTVLVPVGHLEFGQLCTVVALFNLLHGWRFSFGRKCSIKRLSRLELPWPPDPPCKEWHQESLVLSGLMTRLTRLLEPEGTQG